MKQSIRWLGTRLVILCLILMGIRHGIYLWVEQDAFVVPPPGHLTPDRLGVTSQQISFPSGARTSDQRILRGSFVAGPMAQAPAVLIFHGNEEDITHWAAVQKRLFESGFASLVFDYSGYGASTGKPSVVHLDEDGRAAYQEFLALTRPAQRRYVLGFSLGTAALLSVLHDFRPSPHGVVIAAGFASARAAAVTTGLVPSSIAWLLPDVWNSEARLRDVQQPVLIVHSRNDETIPFSHAQRLYSAASASRHLLALDGLPHDAPILADRADHFWPAVLAYLQADVQATQNLAAPARVTLAKQ